MGRMLTTALMSMLAPCAASAGEPASSSVVSSKALLVDGFRPIANGELLVERSFGVDRMETSRVSVMAEEFVAQVPGMPRPRAEVVRWLGDRYESYVRLALGKEEFVCILAQSERCYRADSSRN